MLTPRPLVRSAYAREPQPSDAGTTLVELLVGIIMATVVGTMCVVFLMSTLRATRQADGENEQASTARGVLESWSALTRLAVSPTGSTATGATRFVSVTPTEVRFCAALGTKGADPDVVGVPLGVSLKLDGTQLVEQRWTSCATMIGGAAADLTRILDQRAAQLTNVWVFTPLAGADIPAGTLVNAALLTSTITSGTLPVTPANLPNIAGLQVAFQTVPDPLRAVAVSTYSTVTTLPIGS